MLDETKAKRFANLYNAYCNSDINLIKRILDDSPEEFYDFTSYIGDYLYKKNIAKNILLQKAYIPIKYGYKILNGTKHTNNRDIIIRICLAAEMDIDETNKCLYLNGMPSLEYQSKRDSLIICSIKSKGRLKIENLNDWLLELGFEPIID